MKRRLLLSLILGVSLTIPEAVAKIQVFKVKTEQGRTMKFVVVDAGRIMGGWSGKYSRARDRNPTPNSSNGGGRNPAVVREYELPLQAGIRFGVKVRIPPVPRGDKLIIGQVVTRPETLANGRRVTEDIPYAHIFVDRKYKNPGYWWYRVDGLPDRDFSGEWTFRLVNKGRVLFSQKFDLYKPGAPKLAAAPQGLDVRQPAVEQSKPHAPALRSTPRETKATASSRAGETIKDCEHCPELAVIPAGSFMMGANKNDILPMYPIKAMGQVGNPNRPFGGEKFRPSPSEFPRHRVDISYTLGIGRFEVTVGQFKAFVAETTYTPKDRCFTYEKDKSVRNDKQYKYRNDRNYLNPGYEQTDDLPVVCVSRIDMKAYLAWLSKKTGRNYRLPTEAEWEYAARAGSDTAYSYGNDPRKLCRYANFADGGSSFLQGLLACRDGYDDRPAPVGSLEPNAFGLHDVHGNVFEMVEDCYHPNYKGAPADGSAWMSGSCETYILRSYSFEMIYEGVRSASRCPAANGFDKSNLTGFRVAVTLN